MDTPVGYDGAGVPRAGPYYVASSYMLWNVYSMNGITSLLQVLIQYITVDFYVTYWCRGLVLKIGIEDWNRRIVKQDVMCCDCRINSVPFVHSHSILRRIRASFANTWRLI